jgi:hypothetical protein
MNKDSHSIPDRKTLRKILVNYRETILEEIHSVKDLMALLMKGAKEKWTKGELLEIKSHFVHLSKRVPVLIVFLLPGGLVFLPILVEVLERRRKSLVVNRERRKI